MSRYICECEWCGGAYTTGEQNVMQMLLVTCPHCNEPTNPGLGVAVGNMPMDFPRAVNGGNNVRYQLLGDVL